MAVNTKPQQDHMLIHNTHKSWGVFKTVKHLRWSFSRNYLSAFSYEILSHKASSRNLYIHEKQAVTNVCIVYGYVNPLLTHISS